MPKAQEEFTLPETLAKCADMLYSTRQARLELDKKVEELKRREAMLLEHLIDSLPVSDATGVAGRIARATVVTKEEPQVENWDDFYGYVHKNKAYHLLQRRISGPAIKELWENRKIVKGVGKVIVKSISLNKLK